MVEEDSENAGRDGGIFKLQLVVIKISLLI